ncbi:MAG TPA: hypothetical protein PLP13_02365, partial [bacterium]|nr:hypothetical protein [bacterium]
TFCSGDKMNTQLFQEKVYDFNWKNTGAGPLWCHGSSCIAAIEDKVFICGWETLEDIPPLNCTRWVLYEKTKSNWNIIFQDQEKTREPSPICVFKDGRILVSENPFMLEPEACQGVALPQVSEFFPPDYKKRRITLPCWSEPVVFVEHSYRNFSSDSENCEAILFHNKGYDRSYWTFLDETGRWSHCGKLYWVWGHDYPQPQPTRLCYSNVQLKNRAVYSFGTSDIIEPIPEWRQYKRKITAREWDYDLRRVFFSFTPDITKEPFRYWVEISNREKTAGNARNLDLYVDNNGIIHLLWMEKSCDERLREAFFPDEILNYSIEYAQLKEQKVLERKTILSFSEQHPEQYPCGMKNINMLWGRFHITRKGKLLVFTSIYGKDEGDNTVAENYLISLDSTGNINDRKVVDFKKPFTTFHTASIRNGYLPLNSIHIYGHISKPDNEMWYGRIDVED